MSVFLLLAAMTGVFVTLLDDGSSPNNEDVPENDDAEDSIGQNDENRITPLDLLGTDDADSLTGGDGDDTIDGRFGSDRLYGGSGNDQIDGNYGADFVFGETGADTLSGGGGHDTVSGGEGDDLALGGEGNDQVLGWTGADTISGGDGNDRLFGDAGQISAASDEDGADLINGDAGNDSIYGGGGLDTLIGGDGDDLIADYDLSQEQGVDNGSFVDGGPGNDDIYVDGGSTVTGGTGNDLFHVHTDIGMEGVTEITDFVQGEDRLSFDIVLHESDAGPLSIQDMADGTGAEVRMGDMLVARIVGGHGLTLDDLEANFVIEQNAGPVGHTGTDNDEVIVGNHSDNVIHGGEGNDSIFAGTGNGYLNNWKNYHGGSDVLNGGAGDDYIVAEGGEFNDYNDGSSPIEVRRTLHVDTLDGGEGNDTLIAMNGGTLTGGEGADVFVINQNMRYVDDDAYFGDNLDPDPIIITDYNPNEDVIVVGYLGDHAGFGGPENAQVTVEAREDGQGSDILISGTVVATVIGSETLTFADLSFDRSLARP